MTDVDVGSPIHGRAFFDCLREFGEAPALWSEAGALTHAELAQAAEDMAASWGPGRHLVMISCSNSIETIVAQVAALAHGHVAMLHPPDQALAGRLSETYRPDVVIADGETVIHATDPAPLHADLALLLVTSGSTGSTKLVRLSHNNLRANSRAIIEYLALTEADRAITSLPVHYSYGFSVVASHLEAGASLVVTDHSVADPCFWKIANEQEITSFAGVPYTYDLIDRGGMYEYLPSSLRYVTQAGGHLLPAKVVDWAARGRTHGFDFFVMYGQTEATARMAYVPPWAVESAPDAIGQAVPGGQFRLDPVPESREPGIGELVYTGDNVMMGYAENPADLSKGAGTNELRTGDLARLGSDGFYRWAGRRNRIAKSFGLRIDLDHLEEVLEETSTSAAIVESDAGITVFVTSGEDVLDAVALSTGLPRHAIHVRNVSDLPMTPSGKVDYGRLRQLADAPTAQSGKAGRKRSSEEDVRHAYAVVLHRPDAKPTDSFTSLAGDSLSYVELSVRLADLNVTVEPGWQHLTIAELAATSRQRRAWTTLDSTIVLRAVAIVLIVLSHSDVVRVIGGAHVLFAVAGYNFARFQLGHADRAALWRTRWRSLAQVMAPCVAWIIAVTVLFGAYDIDSIFMLEGIQGFDDQRGRRMWFLEAYFWIQVILILALAFPLIDRVQRRAPFRFALGVLAVALVLRLSYTGIHAGSVFHHEYDLIAIAWCFAAGWAAALAPTVLARVGLTVICAFSSFGFFDDTSRELVLFIGFLVMTWFPALPLPRRLARPIGIVASASLFIYVSHYQFAPAVEEINRWLAVAASIAFGIAFERTWALVADRVRWRSGPPEQPIPPTANVGTPSPR